MPPLIPSTLGDFTAMLRRHHFRFVTRDDKGIWHGTDVVLPGDTISCPISEIPIDATFCRNRLCDCYDSTYDPANR